MRLSEPIDHGYRSGNQAWSASSVEIPLLIATLIGCAACVLSVIAAWSASRSARSLRSMTSMQGELTEIHDYMVKLDAWARRINQRDLMRERRDAASSSAESSPPVSGNAKDDLRRRAGLVAGQPARHREAS